MTRQPETEARRQQNKMPPEAGTKWTYSAEPCGPGRCPCLEPFLFGNDNEPPPQAA
jgi:hypothetical protein